MEPKHRESFERFVSDEGPAIEQLKHFVGRSFAPLLDGTIESLAKLDDFTANLRRNPDWASTPLFADVSDDMSTWLTVRIAYYLARCIRKRYGSEWQMSTTESGAMEPVLQVKDIQLSPLEIASAYLGGGVDGGLRKLVADLDHELGNAPLH